MTIENERILIARQREIAIFREAETSDSSEFLAVYGRRRIGKTYLVEEYFKRNRAFYFYFVGGKNLNTKTQLANFCDELRRKHDYREKKTFADWREAFSAFTDIILKKPETKEKKVIFFDELPFLASRKSGFNDVLGYFWNAHLSKRSDIILIVCGSAASWMIKHVVHNKGDLFHRLTKPAIAMAPFTLKESQEYLQARGAQLNQEQIAELYMVTGGVAFYLKQYKRGESANQFINNNFFNGELRDEFEILFSSLFENYDTHVKVVIALANKRSGVSREELAKEVHLESGGTLTKILTELEQSSFIHFVPRVGSKKREGIYRLLDEYTLFYLKWIAPLGRAMTKSEYWQKQINTPAYNTWHGYAFESLCFKHSAAIKRDLGISALTTYEYGLRTGPAQIDLVIDRSDRVVNLCEMKYTGVPYKMTSDEAKKLQIRKQELTKEVDAAIRRKRQIFVVLVTPTPADRNEHYNSVVDREVNLSALFQ